MSSLLNVKREGLVEAQEAIKVDEIHTHAILNTLKSIEIRQAETCVHLSNQNKSLDRIENILFDNGHDGLVTSHKKLQQRVNLIWGGIVVILTVVAGYLLNILFRM